MRASGRSPTWPKYLAADAHGLSKSPNIPVLGIARAASWPFIGA